MTPWLSLSSIVSRGHMLQWKARAGTQHQLLTVLVGVHTGMTWQETGESSKCMTGSLQALSAFAPSAGKIHWRNTFEQLKLVGPKSMGVALLTAGFVGMVFTIQVGFVWLPQAQGLATLPPWCAQSGPETSRPKGITGIHCTSVDTERALWNVVPEGGPHMGCAWCCAGCCKAGRDELHHSAVAMNESA